MKSAITTLLALGSILLALSAEARIKNYTPYSKKIGKEQHKLRQSETGGDTTIEDGEFDWKSNELNYPEVGCNLDPFLKGNEISIYNATYGFIQGLYSSEQYPVDTGCF